MREAKKKFVRYAVLSVLVLLTALLGIINAAIFTMAARDADEITARIASGKGELKTGMDQAFGRQGPMGLGPVGPDSPETNASMRHFTVRFNEEGEAKIVEFRISAVEEQEAVEWARSLASGSTGWTRGTYRYRVWTQGSKTYVTVIDQGRELLPAYRILIFSVCGTLLGVLASWLVLRFAGERLFDPIEEADRRQKQFLAGAERSFRLPLTVISADTELLERERGTSDQTRSIHRQVRRMGQLVRNIGALAVYDPARMNRAPVSLSELLQRNLDTNEDRFAVKGITLRAQIAEDIVLNGEPEAMEQVIRELIENALKYARGNAVSTLRRENERIVLTAANGTELPEGPADQVFDRFTTLSNAAPDSAGLGLSGVRDIVRAHNGRVSARVSAGIFTLRLDL